MSHSNAAAQQPSVSTGGALLVSNDAATIRQFSESMRQLAMSPEICAEVPTALGLLNQRKFDAVIVDLQLGGHANAVLERVRLSPSNRTAVLFTISDSDAETAIAFKAGSNFVLRRPLSLTSIDRNLKVAYGLIVREQRRYFRCPVQTPATICRHALPEIHGQTVNISEGGIGIATDVSIEPGVKVQVRFTLPGHESQFAVDAAVCWSKETYVGLQFTSLSAHLTSELQEWLSRRLDESLPQSVADKFRNLENAPPWMNEPAEGSKTSITESERKLKAPGDNPNWVALYRAALSESDTERKLPKIELAERNMRQRLGELPIIGSEAAEERQRLSDASRICVG